MKLKSLQKIIHSDLVIIDHRINFRYNNVCVVGGVFYKYKDYTVIGIRARENYLEVSVK